MSEKIIQDYKGIYFDVKFLVGDNVDPKKIILMYLKFNSLPGYGKDVNSISVSKLVESNYYQISTIEWYRNDYRMLDQYFYDGTYRCRIYLDLINGGYFAPDIEIYFMNSSANKTLGMYNNRYYVEETFYIKRIIGLPGETVQIKDGYVYINEQKLGEAFGREVIRADRYGQAAEPIKLGEDEYFVLGDNRNESADSRETSVGILKREELIGRAWVRIWPLNSFGVLAN